MKPKRTALPVLLGCIAFAIVAWKSLSVEGEATGTMVPGFHPTTEAAIDALLRQAGEPSAESSAQSEMGTATTAQPTNEAPKAAVKRAAVTPGIPSGHVYWKTVRAKVTAYEPTWRSCGPHANGKTSIGDNAWVMDGVATDPKAIPYRTYVVIPGVGGREVDDTGSAMRHLWRSHGSYQIDVRMTYYGEAKHFGVKYLDVKLYKKASQ